MVAHGRTARCRQQPCRFGKLNGRAITTERRRLGNRELIGRRNRQPGQWIGQFLNDFHGKTGLGGQIHNLETARREPKHRGAPRRNDETWLRVADRSQLRQALRGNRFRRQHQRSQTSAAANHHEAAPAQVGDRPIHREQRQRLTGRGDKVRTVGQDRWCLQAFAGSRRYP